MAATPKETTVRDALFAQLQGRLSGGAAAYHYTLDTDNIVEGVPGEMDDFTLGRVYVFPQERVPVDRFSGTPPLISWQWSFLIIGVIESNTPYDDREKLAHDITYAITTTPGLGCAGVHVSIERVEYGASEIDRKRNIKTDGICRCEVAVTYQDQGGE